MTRRSCLERQVRSSGVRHRPESLGHLHGELSKVGLVLAVEVDEEPVVALIGHSALEIQPWPAALASRVHMQIAEIGRADDHSMAEGAVRRLQIRDRLSLRGHRYGTAAVGTGAQVTAERHREAFG